MNLCIAFATAHFIAGVIYSAGSLLIQDIDGVSALMITLPLSIMITVFYSWTLSALTKTVQTLKEARQNVKLIMYQRVTLILGISVFIVAFSLVINVVRGFSSF